jgi:hypothetical protein
MDKLIIQVQDSGGHWITIQNMKPRNVDEVRVLLDMARRRRPGKILRAIINGNAQML